MPEGATLKLQLMNYNYYKLDDVYIEQPTSNELFTVHSDIGKFFNVNASTWNDYVGRAT